MSVLFGLEDLAYCLRKRREAEERAADYQRVVQGLQARCEMLNTLLVARIETIDALEEQVRLLSDVEVGGSWL